MRNCISNAIQQHAKEKHTLKTKPTTKQQKTYKTQPTNNILFFT